jgi:hypothetical protein
MRLVLARCLLALLACFFLVGCGLGPKVIPRDRQAYSHALSDSWKEQMLLNMVKLRYGDPPMFVGIANIVNSYSIETEGSIGGDFIQATNNRQNFSLKGKFQDRPTITYKPLVGEDFTRSLLRPIEPSAMLALVQNGWPIDTLFAICVESVNGISNQYVSFSSVREADPDFDRLIELLRVIQASGALSVRMEKNGEELNVFLFFKKADDASIRRAIGEAHELLGLPEEKNEFRIVFGATPEGPGDIALVTRSILRIMMNMGGYIDVPDAHVTDGRAYPGLARFDEASPAGMPMRIHTSRDHPGSNAFVAIRYRQHFFWVDDHDLQTKRVFAFLLLVSTLAETPARGGVPILTIPAG